MSAARHMVRQDMGKLLSDIERLEQVVKDFSFWETTGGWEHISYVKYKRFIALEKTLNDWKDIAGIRRNNEDV